MRPHIFVRSTRPIGAVERRLLLSMINDIPQGHSRDRPMAVNSLAYRIYTLTNFAQLRTESPNALIINAFGDRLVSR